ncbi:hypothetical protein ABIF78_003827 [Bradyrhizobium japonicum]
MKSNDTSFRRYLCSASPRLRPALLAMLTVVLLAGCATADKHGLSPQQRSASDLADSEEIDPAARERISHALGRDADEGALRDALKQQPNNIDAAIPLARALLARNCPNDALEVLDGVLLATPGDLRALNCQSSCSRSRGPSSGSPRAIPPSSRGGTCKPDAAQQFRTVPRPSRQDGRRRCQRSTSGGQPESIGSFKIRRSRAGRNSEA